MSYVERLTDNCSGDERSLGLSAFLIGGGVDVGAPLWPLARGVFLLILRSRDLSLGCTQVGDFLRTPMSTPGGCASPPAISSVPLSCDFKSAQRTSRRPCDQATVV